MYLEPNANLRVPGRFWNLPEQGVSPQLKLLIVDRIVQSMGSDVSPIPVQSDLVRCRSCSCSLEYSLSDL